MTPQAELNDDDIARWQWWSVVAAAAALVVCILGAVLIDPLEFFRAYLAAYVFFWGVSLGSLAILLIYNTTGGAWGYLIRRILEAQIRTLPLMAILFIPVAVGVGYLYLWAQSDIVATDKMLQKQQFYLNKGFFWGRAAVYFVIWVAVVYLLSTWSRREDEQGDVRLMRKIETFAGMGLVIYGLTVHFSSFDWIQSLQSTFHSTIFPPIVATGQILSAMAFALMMFNWLIHRPPISGIVSLKALNDLGNLLFVFVILWAYMVWFQFMLSWIANLPTEAGWYQARSYGGWQFLAWAIFLLNFAIPFLLLLLRVVKQTPRYQAAIASLVFVMQLAFSYYQIMPSFPFTTIADHWMDFLTPVAVGGFWFAYFLQQLKAAPLLALHDLNREHALLLRQEDETEADRQDLLAHG
jgi:hypothetical protein